MADLKEQFVDVLGKQIPMQHWSIAKQLSTLQFPEGDMKLTQHLAIAFNAGVEHAKKSYSPQVETEINQAIRDIDEVADRLRRIRKSL